MVSACFNRAFAWSFNSKACINVPGTQSIQCLVDIEQSIKTDAVLNDIILL